MGTKAETQKCRKREQFMAKLLNYRLLTLTNWLQHCGSVEGYCQFYEKQSRTKSTLLLLFWL